MKTFKQIVESTDEYWITDGSYDKGKLNLYGGLGKFGSTGKAMKTLSTAKATLKKYTNPKSDFYTSDKMWIINTATGQKAVSVDGSKEWSLFK